MKTEYLPAGSPDCPILRLYDFGIAEAPHLLSLCVSLAGGTIERADVPAEEIDGCRLTLISGITDLGVLARDRVGQFDCTLTPDG